MRQCVVGDTRYLLVEETEIISKSVGYFVTTQFEGLVGGAYTSFSQGNAE